MKQTVTVHLYMENSYDYDGDDYVKKWRPIVWSFKVDEEEDRLYVREMPLEVDVPDDFDPTAKQIAALEREREAATAAYMETLQRINQRLAKLQAIGNEVPA